MSFTATYYCPHCEALVELDREGYLDDKAVTPYPFEGWSYVAPDEPFEDQDGVDGIAFTCGEDGALRDDETGCGESFYLSFIRFENGREIDPRTPNEQVELADESPSAPSGPTGPSGPGAGGFWS